MNKQAVLMVVAEYVDNVCALLDSEHAARVRLGEPVVLLFVGGTSSTHGIAVRYAGRTIKVLCNYYDLYALISACEYLGWQYVLGGKQALWGEGMRESPAYRNSDA